MAVSLVPSEGFEPTTPCSEDKCSNPLSYDGIDGLRLRKRQAYRLPRKLFIMFALFAVLMIIVAIQFRDSNSFAHGYIVTYLAENTMLFGGFELFE